jgi:hypothetical protein
MKAKLSKYLIIVLMLVSAVFTGMAGAVTPVGVALSPLPLFQFNQAGVPCSGCQLFAYAAGTSTKQATYTDSTGTTPNANPQILDNNGQGVVYLQTGLNYKFTLSPPYDTDPPTAAYWTEDQIYNNALSAFPFSVATGTSDVITGNFTVPSPILTNGYSLMLGIVTPNTTTTPIFAPTLNGQLQTAHVIKKWAGNSLVALAASDLTGNAWLVYNLANTVWVVQNPGATSGTFSGNLTGNVTGNITGIVTGTAGSTLIGTVNGSTYTGTAGQTYTFPTTTATIARTDAANTFTGTQTFSSTINGNINGNAATATSATTATTATNVTNALGQGQTRQLPVRALNTPYTNSTALPIFITVTLGFPVTSLAILTVNGAYVEVISNTGSAIAYSVFSCIILPGESYEILVSSGTPTIQYWTEIR